MVVNRALEIFNSTEKLTVLYINQPVWIESLNTSNKMATIKIMGTEQLEEVPISELIDTGSAME